MAPIRVLQVVGRMERAGLETLIMNIYRNIDRSKVQFDFLAHYGEEADYNEEIRSLGGRIFEMPVIKTTTKTNYHKIFQYIKALKAFFKEHQEFKVVHGHMTNTASIYMPIARRHGVKCCIAHSHLARARQGLTGVVTNILQLPIERVSNEYFSCSEKAAEWMFSKKNITEKKVKIIHNAIDSKLYDYNEDRRKVYRESLKLDNKLVIGHVGRFYYQKNHDYLIDIFNELVKINPESVLLLIGEGVLRNEIESKVNLLNLNNKVKILGKRSDIAGLMQAMDIFVMPSHFEGLPVVGVEAQAAGLKCVMSDAITTETDITGNIKFLPLSIGPQAWAKEILDFSNCLNRETTRDKIIKAGYDIKTVSEWMQDFYINRHNGITKDQII
ncbi:glycosyltransferase family 1 protein [Neobacillus mesonae]|uniref:glycosyltransferase family 1 protein n=1 Tax=Neobacillus mesonae TaxID=1193713 RepID=UPI0008377F70|nr:glycosyltransferase family 1 protein [Neobacillus mesonae]